MDNLNAIYKHLWDNLRFFEEETTGFVWHKELVPDEDLLPEEGQVGRRLRINQHWIGEEVFCFKKGKLMLMYYDRDNNNERIWIQESGYSGILHPRKEEIKKRFAIRADWYCAPGSHWATHQWMVKKSIGIDSHPEFRFQHGRLMLALQGQEVERKCSEAMEWIRS